MIRSTFAGFTTAQLALQNSQRALDVVGQNIANINTLGYTRQRVDLVSLNFRKGNYSNTPNASQIGFGSEIRSISQLRDPFLDVQYRNQVSKVGYTDSKQAILENLSTIFDETDLAAIKDAFKDLETQLQKYSDPSNVGKQEFDTMVRSSCENLVNLFHTYASDLKAKKEEDATQLEKSTIPDINSILKNISELNDTIRTSQILGNPALELMDERNLLLDQLAAEFPIKVSYKDVEFSPGHKIQELQVDLVTDSGYKKLIDNGKYASFDVTRNPDNNTVKIGFTPASGSAADRIDNIQNHVKNGSIKGTADMLNMAGGLKTGDTTEEKGYDYYQSSLDCLVNVFAKTMNDLNGTNLFESSGSGVITAASIKVSQGWVDGTIKLKTAADGATGSTDNGNLLKLIEALKAKRDFSFTDDDGDNINLGFNGDFHSCYANMETILGTDNKGNTSLLSTQLSVCTKIANSRDEVSAVSLDEEGIDLMHYSQSYSAAARLMTTLDEMLEKLINI